MEILKQSTATGVLIGPFVNAADGTTPVTAINGSSSTIIDLYKGTTRSDLTTKSSGGVNNFKHSANGYYSLSLVASNVGVAGAFTITGNVAGSPPVKKDFMIVPASVYTALVGGTTRLPVNVISAGSAIATLASTATQIKTTLSDSVTLADGAISKTKIAVAAFSNSHFATIAEPTLASSKTPGVLAWHVYSRFYHGRKQTSTAQTIFKADGTTTLATLTVADDGTIQSFGGAT